MAVTAEQATTFGNCMAVGGFAVFPADTVYGLACDPEAKEALQRIARLKRRRMDKPSAVLFFDLDMALEALAELDGRTRAALTALLPGPVTLLVPNPAARYPLACGPHDPYTLGVRVPRLDDALAPLRSHKWPVLQTSANLSGGPDPRELADVPEVLRDHADMLLDAGPRIGTASTVIDLRAYAQGGGWTIVREGAMPARQVDTVLESL